MKQINQINLGSTRCRTAYVLNELRKEVVESNVYSERKSMLIQVQFFLTKLAELQRLAQLAGAKLN
jgi:hypothetical protein